MNDLAGAAPAAAEPVAAPQTEAQPALAERQDESAVDRSTRGALDRAFAEVEKQDAAATKPKADAKPAEQQQPAADGPDRDEQGRFKAKDATAAADPAKPAQEPQKPAADVKQPVSAMEAPTRFSADAKAAWKDVPDAVKGEVGRAFRELEGGLKEYQQVFEPLKPYYQMAQERGVQVHEALKNYVSLDLALVSKDPQERLSTIEHLLGIAGISPKEYAAFITGQPADQAQSQHDRTIRELRQQISELQGQIGGMNQSITQRREDEALKQVEAFAEANPRLKDADFQKVVFKLLETKMAPNLPSAFDMASRLNPAPVETAQPAPAQGAKPAAPQTRNGNLSVTGAPGSGSNPAKRKAPATARDSVENAFASLGLG